MHDPSGAVYEPPRSCLSAASDDPAAVRLPLSDPAVRPSPPLSRRFAVVGVGLALAGAALTWKSLRRAGPGSAADLPLPAARSATVVNDQQALPEFALHSPAGTLTRTSLTGHWSVVFFGYTQCPDVCPTALNLMAEFHRRLPAAERPKVLFISVDAQRDTLPLLAEYVPAFDASFVGATGSDAELAGLVKHLGIRYERHPGVQPGSYTVDHTASMFLIDPQARLKAVFSPPHALEAMLADYRRLTG